MLILSLWACVTADSYPHALAKVACRRFDECGVLTADEPQEECVDVIEGDLDGDWDGCTFNAAAANQCLEFMRTAACTELFGGGDGGAICNEVWSECPGD